MKNKYIAINTTNNCQSCGIRKAMWKLGNITYCQTCRQNRDNAIAKRKI